MSDRTLYEINGEIPSNVWNELRRRVEDGSLVPVEPDYKGSWGAALELGYHISAGALKLIVDAAYFWEPGDE